MQPLSTLSSLPLADLEPRLRHLLPADLYATAWMEQNPANLEKVFDHLRTLQRILVDYLPRALSANPTEPGRIRRGWEEGALMFTDLSGFTPLMEAHAPRGEEGAQAVLEMLNDYFASMIEIVGKSGGELLEFTGDAMLVEFPVNRRNDQIQQAVRAGLRMQRAMERFKDMETEIGEYSLGMRIGVHAGRFLTADIGTPRRMEHVLLGDDVQATKHAEGAGVAGRVNLTQEAYEQVTEQFRFEPGEPGHMLVIDDLSDDELGTFDIGISRRRMSSGVLLDRSVPGLISSIEEMVERVEPLAAFIPEPILKLLVESAQKREIPPAFPQPTVLFVNLLGLPESVEGASDEEIVHVVKSFSQIFAKINAAVEARGGVLKKVTYHIAGSDMMILFGAPVAHSNDPIRGAEAALAIRDIILSAEPPTVGGDQVNIECQIGISLGPVFSAEIGEPRGRREFNVLGDTVNTAARVMGKALGNRILVTKWLHDHLKDAFELTSLGSMPLKGKSKRIRLYALERQMDEQEIADHKASVSAD